MSILTTYAIIALAALIQASFQLSVSTFTLMSGHHLGRARSHQALNRLSGGFLLGVLTMTVLLLCTISLIVIALAHALPAKIILAAACGLCFGVGVAVWLFYYPLGTKCKTLWLPRKSARYIAERSKATDSSGEAFGLGLASVFAELAFTVAPLGVAATLLIPHSPLYQLGGIVLYTILSSLLIVVIIMLVGSGHSIGRIQKWRAHNKTFLQFAAGTALLILGAILYVYYVYPYAIGADV